ncbi:hypothetical protein M011DRAFT_456282 [Sporormia fimetaria CBS 119925]|uniref:Uncharacterized protein n=1 Tax=Sporormia fimetaria CBS 119925 TaxID=1340428 RepID=A0A6A6VID5_9PLEO|nr:hypothetical protein M011DRAFT_456282 [Sporormia fimetaria CBS 119925]
MDLNLSDPGPSPLEYARSNGLCREYFRYPLYSSVGEPPTDDVLEADLRDSVDCPTLSPGTDLTKERLAVDRDAALFLKTVISLREPPEDGHIWEPPPRRSRALKFELPLLRSDNDIDLQSFGSTAMPPFDNIQALPDVVDEENDEGLQWPARTFQDIESINTRISTEKISVTKDVLLFLQSSVKDSWTEADAEALAAQQSIFQRNPVTRPMTPPLLPLSPPVTPYVPSSPGSRLPMLSTDSDFVGAELKALDDQIMANDAFPSDDMLFDDLDPQDTLDNPPLPATKRKIEDIKIEGPLTPPMFPDSPSKRFKAVKFQEMVQEYIQELPSNTESGDCCLSGSEDFAGFYTQFTPLTQDINRRLENEKLSCVDTTKRVDVPQMDFMLPVAPWDFYSRKNNGLRQTGMTEADAQMKFLQRVQHEQPKDTLTWHGGSKLDRELSWAVFPLEMASVKVEERLHGEEVLAKILSDMTLGHIATSSTDIWIPDTLRLLEHDDCDDELEAVEYSEPPTLTSMIQKRKRELDEVEHQPKPANSRQQISSKARRVSGNADINDGQSATNTATAGRNKANDNGAMFGGAFSASSALQMFMESRGKQVPESQKIPFPSKEIPFSEESAGSGGGPAGLYSQMPQAQQLPNPPKSAVTAYGPPIPQHLPPCSFILSSTVLRQRGLARDIRKIYSDASFIERDFALPHSPSDEADLILSPSTGLICTTIQQLKQRALPGQPDRSPLKERLLSLQSRYERLLVLVSEGLRGEAEQSGSSRPLDNRDLEALTEFKKYTDALEPEIVTSYVQGGEVALASGIVCEMAKYGLPHGSADIGELKLMEDETTWEVFLRRAGLNAFAAQAILGSFKEPYLLPLETGYSDDSQFSEKSLEIYGLQAYLMLDPAERIKRFEVLLGGNRVLRRVNDILERRWLSGANGFRG